MSQVEAQPDPPSKDPGGQATIGSIMTRNPMVLPDTASLAQAARAMRDSHIGAVLVSQNSNVSGIVTDRDIVIRAIADGQDPNHIPLSRIASKAEHTLEPSAPLDRAIEMMARHHIRRIPVVADGQAVGIVSLGDLAALRDPKSVLGQISTAPSTK